MTARKHPREAASAGPSSPYAFARARKIAGAKLRDTVMLCADRRRENITMNSPLGVQAQKNRRHPVIAKEATTANSA
jgi:hypothetical protein